MQDDVCSSKKFLWMLKRSDCYAHIPNRPFLVNICLHFVKLCYISLHKETNERDYK